MELQTRGDGFEDYKMGSACREDGETVHLREIIRSMKYTIYPNRLYNLDIDDIGLFKLKTVPLKYRFPYYHFDGTADHKVWSWYYMPWHFWRVSCGESLRYVGGFTVKQAIRNCVHVYSREGFIRFGKENSEYVSKVTRG